MPPTRSQLHLKKSAKAPQSVSPAGTGNDDASGEPVGNRGNGDALPPAGHEEAANGDRGAASGRNQEQMAHVTGKPGAP
jgi:hypothetical protein